MMLMFHSGFNKYLFCIVLGRLWDKIVFFFFQKLTALVEGNIYKVRYLHFSAQMRKTLVTQVVGQFLSK